MPANTTPVSAPTVIDLTPNWVGLLPALIEVILHGNASSRYSAIESLRQVCAAVDASNKRCAAVNSRNAAAANNRKSSRVINMDPLHTYTVRVETQDKATLSDLLECEIGCTISAYEISASEFAIAARELAAAAPAVAKRQAEIEATIIEFACYDNIGTTTSLHFPLAKFSGYERFSIAAGDGFAGDEGQWSWDFYATRTKFVFSNKPTATEYARFAAWISAAAAAWIADEANR